VSRRPRGVLVASFAALLPLLVFAAFALTAALGAFRASDEARLRDTARALAAAVDAQLGSYVAVLETLAGSPILNGPMDAAAFEARARIVGERMGGWIVLIGEPPGYQMLANTRRQPGASLPSAVQLEGQEVLLAPLAGLFSDGRPGISDLFPGTLSGGQVLAILVPVDRPDQPRRALALAIQPAALRALLARQDLPAGTFAAIADGQQRVLAHSFDPEGRWAGAQAPDWVGAAIEGKQRTLVVGPGWSGEDNVYAVERLTQAPGWVVTVAEPEWAQHASAWAALRWLIAGSAALAVGLAVLVWASRRETLLDARREAAALHAGRAEISRLHGGLPAIIYLRVADRSGTSRLLYRAGDIEAVLGWPAATFDGVDSLLPWIEPGWPGNDAFMLRVLKEEDVTAEYRFRQPDGSWRSLRTRCRLLSRRPDGGGEVVGYVLNTTAEREAQMRAMAAARLASLGEMAAGLAHEVKQPLQAISLAAERAKLAARNGNAIAVDERLNRIIKHAHRTADMLDHLRRFARGADDGATPETVPLRETVQGALDLMQSALRDASITVDVALGDPAPAIRGQAVLLEQVLSNLLLNARDALATRPAGAPRRIRIAATPQPDGTVQLTVSDTGGGVAPAAMARLFEPFVTTKDADSGTGLGLSICHGLIKGMGGSITAHNDAEGAVFTITLQRDTTTQAARGRLSAG
jgi:C4-dicarboxylate-specific signal transduction histidine kinase